MQNTTGKGCEIPAARIGRMSINTAEGVKRFAVYTRKKQLRWFYDYFWEGRKAKFEEIRDTLSDSVCSQYDQAKTYRDGKWVMFEPTDTSEFEDYIKLLAIKRKPNRK